MSKSTVQRWVRYASGQRLERVDFSNKKTGRVEPANKSGARVESQVLRIRQYLKDQSILGHYGAAAIRTEMIRRGLKKVPTSRTISNIVKRHGLVDKRHRVRYPSPPPGWYLQDLVSKKVELDSGDIVEKLYLCGGQEVQLFNMISLHGSLLFSVADKVITAEITINALMEHWQQFGLPCYVQFDNDMVFQGSRRPNAIGRVIRFCLSVGVIPIFTTPYEQGFQGKIERFNGEIQRKFWRRKHFKNIRHVRQHLKQYVFEHRLKQQQNIVTAPKRRRFPRGWKWEETKWSMGTNAMIIYLRRTDEHGCISLLENDFLVCPHWINRLVRAELDIAKGVIRFYALRRADWKKHPLIKTIKFNVNKIIKNNKN